MRYFVYLDDDFNIGMSIMSLTEPELEGYTEIDEGIYHKLNGYKKYDPNTGELSEKIIYEPIINEHEEITRQTHESVEITSGDNLINMDMLLAIDEKLNAIMAHLGL